MKGLDIRGKCAEIHGKIKAGRSTTLFEMKLCTENKPWQTQWK